MTESDHEILARYAAGVAHFEHFPPALRDEVVKRLDAAEAKKHPERQPVPWAVVARHGSKALDKAVGTTDTAALLLYAETHGKAKRALAHRQAGLDDIGAIDLDAAPPPAPPPGIVPPPKPPESPGAPVVVPLAAPTAPAPVALVPLAAAPVAPLLPPVAPQPSAPAFTYAAAKEPRLSLQQYASLRAEVMHAPGETLIEVRARYGLDEEGDLREVEAWRAKFSTDVKLFEHYKGLFQYFRGQLAGGGRG